MDEIRLQDIRTNDFRGNVRTGVSFVSADALITLVGGRGDLPSHLRVFFVVVFFCCHRSSSFLVSANILFLTILLKWSYKNIHNNQSIISTKKQSMYFVKFPLAVADCTPNLRSPKLRPPWVGFHRLLVKYVTSQHQQLMEPTGVEAASGVMNLLPLPHHAGTLPLQHCHFSTGEVLCQSV